MPIQRLFDGIRYLDGLGPSMRNIEKLDMAAMPMVISMMKNGLQVDLDHFKKMEKELADDMEKKTEAVRSLTGYYINIDSGDQVSDLLFKKLGIKQVKPKMTPSGERESVADEILTQIQHEHPAIGEIQDYKEFSKLKGTYVVPMPGLARHVGFGEWRMFPNLGQTRIPSGRFNCKDPNLLAIPTRTARGRDIRKGFITKSGWRIVSVDLSQIEPRIAAHRSKDPGLIRVYQNGEDIYSDFATTAFKLEDKRYKDPVSGKWKYPTVDDDEHRRPSKTCVLAALYDVTGQGLSFQMPVICANCGLDARQHTCKRFRSLWVEQKCDELLVSFYLKYDHLIRMRKQDHGRVRKYGYLWDDWGRLMHVQAVRSVLPWVVSTALREAANFPIQSTACGVLKIIMAQVWADTEGIEEIRYLLPIHDEILAEVREDLVPDYEALVKDRIENCVKLDVPTKGSSANAESWGHLPK